MDIQDIELVIQWRATCDLCTLWQRFGRAARDRLRHAIALLLVESSHFDDVKAKSAARSEKRKAAKAIKKRGAPATAEQPPNKRRAAGASSQPPVVVPIVVPVPVPEDVANDSDSDHEEDQDVNGAPPAIVSPVVSMSDEERRDLYTALPEHNVKGVRKHHGIVPAMDDFINCTSRGLTCFRKPPDLFFNNDKCGMYSVLVH